MDTRPEASDRTYPTLYSMEKIGVNNAAEAVEAFHFCTPGCRDAYARATAPLPGAHWQEGDETLSLEGLQCDQCGAPLDGQHHTPPDLYDLLSRSLSVIELSEGADEHAELIAELRAVVR